MARIHPWHRQGATALDDIKLVSVRQVTPAWARASIKIGEILICGITLRRNPDSVTWPHHSDRHGRHWTAGNIAPPLREAVEELLLRHWRQRAEGGGAP